jgi:hypothetical protein
MSQSTPRREQVLHLIRLERLRQIEAYGSNADLDLGFEGTVSAYPWLLPFSGFDGEEIESGFREDYELYKASHGGKPTWMHLIREEVAELFKATDKDNRVEEAVQVAALCVSLLELLLEQPGDAS